MTDPALDHSRGLYSDILAKMVASSPLYRGTRYETLPVPWYGRLRRLGADALIEWSEALEALAWRITYRPKLKNPPPPIPTGTTVNFRKYASLTTTTKEVPTDDPQ